MKTVTAKPDPDMVVKITCYSPELKRLEQQAQTLQSKLKTLRSKYQQECTALALGQYADPAPTKAAIEASENEHAGMLPRIEVLRATMKKAQALLVESTRGVIERAVESKRGVLVNVG